MNMPPRYEHARAWSRELGVQARRAWMLLNGRSVDERDDDDDDDLPRPNAVVTILPWIGRAERAPALA